MRELMAISHELPVVTTRHNQIALAPSPPGASRLRPEADGSELNAFVPRTEISSTEPWRLF